MLYQRLTRRALVLACGLTVGCGPPPTAATNNSAVPPAPAASAPTQSAVPSGSVQVAETETGEAENAKAATAAGATQFDPSELIKQSAALTQRLLAGEVTEAHQLFSPLVREQVTVDALRSLSSDLRSLFGPDISTLDFLETELGEINLQTRTESCQVRHLVKFAGNKQAISTVLFYLPLDEQLPATSDLAAIDVRETWPSFSPASVRTAAAAVEILFPNSLIAATEANNRSLPLDQPPGQASAHASTDFEGLLHPDMLPHFQTAAVSDLIARIQRHFGRVVETPQWATWSYQTAGQQLSARGTVITEWDRVELQADFSQERLIGISLIGSSYAASTLDMLTTNQQAADAGSAFWEQVFSGQLADAHKLLAPRFQQELPVEEFVSAIEQSDLVGLSALRNIELDTIRFSNRLQRADPVAFAAYYLARFEDATQQAVQCEFGSHSTPRPMLSFANDFEIVLPVSDTSTQERLVDAFLSAQPEQVKQWLDAPGRERFDAQIASLFMGELKRLLGNQPPTLEDVRTLHVYRAANRAEQLRATLVGQQRSIAFEAVVQADQLKSFSFLAPELESFVGQMKESGSIEELGQEFIRQWMKDSQTQQAAEKMVASADPNALLAQLSARRDTLLAEHGNFLWSDMLTWQPIAGTNQVSAVYELEFADQTLDMQLIFEVSAIGAEISSASVLAEAK